MFDHVRGCSIFDHASRKYVFPCAWMDLLLFQLESPFLLSLILSLLLSRAGWSLRDAIGNQQPSCNCCLLPFPPCLYHPVFQAFVFEGCCGRLSRAFDVKSRCPTPPALPSATGSGSWSQMGESCWSGVICLWNIRSGWSQLPFCPSCTWKRCLGFAPQPFWAEGKAAGC